MPNKFIDLTIGLTSEDVEKAIEDSTSPTTIEGIPTLEAFTDGIVNITDVTTGIVYNVIEDEVKPIPFITPTPTFLQLPTTLSEDVPNPLEGNVIVFFDGTDLIKRTIIDETVTDTPL